MIQSWQMLRIDAECNSFNYSERQFLLEVNVKKNQNKIKEISINNKKKKKLNWK